MSVILDSWKNSHEEIIKKSVNQLLGICGDGKLYDGNPTSIEFREFLSKVSSLYLKKYSLECRCYGKKINKTENKNKNSRNTKN
jgi:hypothetical protein